MYSETGNAWTLGGQLTDCRRNHAGVLVSSPRGPVIYVLGGYGVAPPNPCTALPADPIFSSEVTVVGSTTSAADIPLTPGAPASGRQPNN